MIDLEIAGTHETLRITEGERDMMLDGGFIRRAMGRAYNMGDILDKRLDAENMTLTVVVFKIVSTAYTSPGQASYKQRVTCVEGDLDTFLEYRRANRVIWENRQ